MYIEYLDQCLTSSEPHVFAVVESGPPGPNFHLYSRFTPTGCFISAPAGLKEIQHVHNWPSCFLHFYLCKVSLFIYSPLLEITIILISMPSKPNELDPCLSLTINIPSITQPCQFYLFEFSNLGDENVLKVIVLVVAHHVDVLNTTELYTLKWFEG